MQRRSVLDVAAPKEIPAFALSKPVAVFNVAQKITSTG
jgi:hypothetical protein